MSRSLVARSSSSSSLARTLAALTLAVVGLVPSAGCLPSTQYNKGVDVDYRPSAASEGQSRVAGSAIAITEPQRSSLEQHGVVYLGELEAHAERDTINLSTGARDLEGRMSIEAAMRGATHFELRSSAIDKRLERQASPLGTASHDATTQVSRLKVRYALYRVEPARWSELPRGLVPSAYGSPAKAAPTMAAPSTTAASL